MTFSGKVKMHLVAPPRIETKARSITMDNQTFPKTGFVRLSQILAPAGPIPVSKSTWWAKVKSGHFPQSCGR